MAEQPRQIVSVEELASADAVLRRLQIALGAEGRRCDVAVVWQGRQIILGLCYARYEEIEVAEQELGMEKVN